jgi:uncharacterized protein (TIGR02598 family)
MSRSPAFTLIETVLSIGILSTVLIAAMGLFPPGLRTAQEAARRTAEIRIIQAVSERCAAAIPAVPLYFSRHGSLLPDKGPETFFTVTVLPGQGIGLPGNPDHRLRSALINIRDPTPNWLLTRTLVLPP